MHGVSGKEKDQRNSSTLRWASNSLTREMSQREGRVAPLQKHKSDDSDRSPGENGAGSEDSSLLWWLVPQLEAVCMRRSRGHIWKKRRKLHCLRCQQSREMRRASPNGAALRLCFHEWSLFLATYCGGLERRSSEHL